MNIISEISLLPKLISLFGVVDTAIKTPTEANIDTAAIAVADAVDDLAGDKVPKEDIQSLSDALTKILNDLEPIPAATPTA